jgi:succinyl-diaminopimelate desuccinylase
VRFEGDGSYPVDNLFATCGTAGKHLLFAGHTDVVPPGDGWTHEPFAADIDSGILYGRGAADMKSGIAAFIAAIAAAGDTNGRISLAITNDEEQDAVNGTEKLLAWAKQQGHTFDFAIVGEPSATAIVGDSIKVGRRGSFSGRITVTGVQGHVAYPDKARNPLPVLAAAVTALKAVPLDAGTSQFPPSNLEFTTIDVGNETSNVIPARGAARFNIRFNDTWTPERLDSWVRERLATVEAAGCDIQFEPVGRPSRSFLSPPGGGLDVLVETITGITGTPPQLSTGGGTSDARFIADYCPVVECGLPGPSMHKVDEHIRISDLVALTGLYRAFLAAYFR